MLLINSYIFLKKEDEITKDEEGNYVIIIKDDVPTLFQKLFNTEEDDLLSRELEDDTVEVSKNLQDLFYKICKGKFIIYLNDCSNYEIKYKFTCVNSSYYLDLSVEIEQEENGILILEEINKLLVENKNAINKDYIIIKSYDRISEFYCNQIYPKLNRFERKLRKLLYLIYTGRFEKDYFKKTTSEELQSTIKGKIKSKETNKKKKEFDYAQVFLNRLILANYKSYYLKKNGQILNQLK